MFYDVLQVMAWAISMVALVTLLPYQEHEMPCYEEWPPDGTLKG